MEEKKVYECLTMRLIEIQMEKGYASSPAGTNEGVTSGAGAWIG